MALSKQKVENRLLAHHLFPRIAKRGDEFPPCFVSEGFTSNVANKLMAVDTDRPDGYGVMSLRATRFDLAPRNMEVLHPYAHAKVVRELKVSWDAWKFIEVNPSSALRLTDHADKRVFSMIPNASVNDLMFPGGRFLAKIDVSNFYESVYTHAIPWAVHGIEQAKASREDGAAWTNTLDRVMRLSRRRETTGISTGPGTSAIVGEIMLGAVDERLQDKGYTFQRYIDDYYAVFPTRNVAEAFVRDVRDELSLLKLAVHPTKTKIEELPSPVYPRWMRDLRSLSRAGQNTLGKLFDLLDETIDSPHQVEEEGSLRYALVSIESALNDEDADEEARLAMVDRLLAIGFLRPTAVSTACRLLRTHKPAAVFERAAPLNKILREHVANRRTDVATWIIYLLLKNHVPIEQDVLEEIIKSRDGLSMALLTSDKQFLPMVRDFVEGFEQRRPPAYIRDEYWLVYYQLWLAGHCSAAAYDEGFYADLQPLADDGVSFIDIGAVSPYLPVHAPRDAVSGGSSGVGGLFGGGPYAG